MFSFFDLRLITERGFRQFCSRRDSLCGFHWDDTVYRRKWKKFKMKITMLVRFGKIRTACVRARVVRVNNKRGMDFKSAPAAHAYPSSRRTRERAGRSGCTIRKLIQRPPRPDPFSSGYLPFFTHCFSFFL